MTNERALLTIRFVGPELQARGMPIYELGTAFVALQRIVNKAYLAETDSLTKGAVPEKTIRKSLALQISAHERRSDFFALAPLLTDPTAVKALTAAASFVYDVAKAYAAKKVVDILKSDKSESKHIFIGSIHADVVNIVNRIDNIGGCESIEIGAPRHAPNDTLRFEAETSEYARRISYERYLGRSQELIGDVFKLYPNIGMVEVRRSRGKKCKVFLSEPDFERVRLSKIPSPRIRAFGRPRYKMGAEGPQFDEFEAQELRSVS